MTEKKQRSSNFELLRILLMLLIIAHHYVVNSGIAAVDGPIFANPTAPHALYLLLWGAWGKIGINCFVLLSSWFMCEKTISLRKFLKLLLEFMFYRIVIALVFWLTGYEKITLNGVLNALIPIRELADSFAETYLVFFLFIPFLNILIHHLTERQHLRLLALLCFVYVFFGTFRPLFFGDDELHLLVYGSFPDCIIHPPLSETVFRRNKALGPDCGIICSAVRSFRGCLCLCQQTN